MWRRGRDSNPCGPRDPRALKARALTTLPPRHCSGSPFLLCGVLKSLPTNLRPKMAGRIYLAKVNGKSNALQLPLHAADETGLFRTFCDRKRHGKNPFHNQNQESNPKHNQTPPIGAIDCSEQQSHTASPQVSLFAFQKMLICCFYARISVQAQSAAFMVAASCRI